MVGKYALMPALSCYALIAQPAFAQSAFTPATKVDRATIAAVLDDGTLMEKLNAQNGPTVECMIGALANVYRPTGTSEEAKALAARVQEAGAHCGLRAQALRSMTSIQAKFPNLTDDQARQVGERLIAGQALIGAALEYGKTHHS